jgi:hypothetical protein
MNNGLGVFLVLCMAGIGAHERLRELNSTFSGVWRVPKAGVPVVFAYDASVAVAVVVEAAIALKNSARF